jgi:hypothetical protein
LAASTAVATTGVTTAAVLLGTDILSHYHIHLYEQDVGYAILLANSFAHYAKPYVAALLAKVFPNVIR